MFPTQGQHLQFSPFDGNTPQDLSAHMSAQGYAAVRRQADARHNRRVMEAARLYADVMSGRQEPIFIREAMNPRNPALVQHLAESYPGLYGDPGGRMLGLREAMAVTDYQALFVDVLDRLYYGTFNMWPITSWQVVRRHPLRDFRIVKRYLADGMVSPIVYRDPAEMTSLQNLYGPVPQGGAVLATASTAAIEYQPLLGQTGDAINWAALRGDDLGMFQECPKRLAIAANRGIARFICGKFFDVNGPIGTLYSSGYGNIINIANGALHDNPPLGVDGIADGLSILYGMKDSSGEPIMLGTNAKIYLYYGSNNEVTAQMLANAISVFTTNHGGTPNATPATGYPQTQIQARNWLIDRLTPVMDPYINLIAANNPGSWALVMDPNAVERPAVEIGYFSDFDPPQLFQEVPNTMRVGGGVDVTMGNFWSMNQNMKIVSVIGGAPIDGRTTVGSNGSGS